MTVPFQVMWADVGKPALESSVFRYILRNPDNGTLTNLGSGAYGSVDIGAGPAMKRVAIKTFRINPGDREEELKNEDELEGRR